jgi:hydrogenase maturation factor
VNDGLACSCITCRDEASTMRIVRLDGERDLALCETAGGHRQTVEVALIDGVAEGDALLVHAGTAIARAGPTA